MNLFFGKRWMIALMILAGQLSGASTKVVALGLDLSARDTTVKAGDDFFRFASGHWFDNFIIPEDRSSQGPFSALSETAEIQVHALIEESKNASAAKGSATQLIGDYYAAYMDEALIESRGLELIRPDLNQIAAAKTERDFAVLFARPGMRSPILIGIGTDLKAPDRYAISIRQGVLGLPDRDYYLSEDAKMQETRERYREFIIKILVLAEQPNAEAKADAIIAFEKAIASVSWTREQRRQVENRYNPRSKAELRAEAVGVDWQTLFDELSIGTRDRFILSQPSAVTAIARVVAATDSECLRAYLTLHLLSGSASVLPRKFDEAVFAFYGQHLAGQPAPRERWKRAIVAVDDALGDQVGAQFVQRHFPATSKQQMQRLVENLRAAFRLRIERLEWMSAETKLRAQEKLAALEAKIGYPDAWKDYRRLEIRANDPLGNLQRVAAFKWQLKVERLDKTVDKLEWAMSPQTVNASYSATTNSITFPAAILQPPFFDPAADDAVNYGAIGAIIGHEISHALDDQGRKFAADGSLTDWWKPEDAMEFRLRAAKLSEQYDQFEVLPGLRVRGTLTIGENLGDLCGLLVAFDAYHLALQGGRAPIIDGLSGDQRFFLAWAQVWRTKDRPEALRRLVLTDPHCPPYFRVNGPVRNIDAWYDAFDVKPGDRLFIERAERVRIW